MMRLDERFLCFSVVSLLVLLSFSIFSTSVLAEYANITGNVTFIVVNTSTFIGNVTMPQYTSGPPYGPFGALLTFTNETNGGCSQGATSFTWAPGQPGPTAMSSYDYNVSLNRSGCTYTVTLIINDAVLNSAGSLDSKYNSSVILRGVNITGPNATLNFQLIPSTNYNMTNTTGRYRVPGAFALNYTNVTLNTSALQGNATFIYARRGVVPKYIYTCSNWTMGQVYNTSAQVPYGCNGVNASRNYATGNMAVYAINGSFVVVNVTNPESGILLIEDKLTTYPVVSVPYGVQDNVTNVTIVKWANRQPAYYAWVPIMRFNITSGRPYIATSGFIEAMFYNVPMFQNPTFIELPSINMSVNLTFTGNGTINLTYGPRFDTVNFQNETKLLPAWAITHTENFMGQSVTRTFLSPSFGPLSPTIYYNYNGTTCGPYELVVGTPQASTTITNNTPISYANCSKQVIYDFTNALITLVDLPTSAGTKTLEALFSLAPPSFGSEFASLSSPIFLTNQSLSGGFIPGPDSGPPAPGASTNIEMVVSVNNSLTDWNFTGTNYYIHFLYPKNVTTYNSDNSTEMQVNVGSNFTLYNKTGTSWFKIANESWNEPGVVSKTNCVNMTDNLPGSLDAGNLIMLCFHEFDFNLTSVNGWNPGERNSNITLNMTAALNVSILEELTPPSGGAGSNQYNTTLNTPSAGSINLTDKVPNVDAADVTSRTICIDGNCSAVNYKLGSLEVSFTQSGTHTVSVTYARAAPTAAAAVVTAAGGSTGGTTAGAAAVTISFSSITTFTPKTISETTLKDSNTKLTEIYIAVANRVVNVKITVEKLSAKPTTITQDVFGKVYEYMGISQENLNETDIASAKIKFKVEQSWTTNNSIDTSKVYLYRFANNQWNKLNTTKLSEDTSYIYYEAATPGFSTFAVSGEQKVVVPTTTTTVPPTTPIPTTTTTTVPPMLPIAPGVSTEIILLIVGLVIIIAVIIIVLKLKPTKRR